MKIEYITIDAGQRFDAVMPEIPTNSIINKTVTGCGATYAEINAPRHSVIIEPNVPVIEGKMKKHPQILGVFEGGLYLFQAAVIVTEGDDFAGQLGDEIGKLPVEVFISLTDHFQCFLHVLHRAFVHRNVSDIEPAFCFQML